MSVRVLIADDHPLLRAGVRTLLESTFNRPEIFEATDGREALDMAMSVRPEIVLMDISMPELNGVDATRRLVSALPMCHVIMLSMYHDEDRMAQCLRAGAKGYIVKEARRREHQSPRAAQRAPA
jgi:DNA-binding NarL/FixJ family response regulator